MLGDKLPGALRGLSQGAVKGIQRTQFCVERDRSVCKPVPLVRGLWFLGDRRASPKIRDALTILAGGLLDVAARPVTTEAQYTDRASPAPR